MKAWFLGIAAMALCAQVFAASAPTLNQETQDDIAKHEAIAAAHNTAAKCLREGKPDAVCERAL
jgi:hypothetical protein